MSDWLDYIEIDFKVKSIHKDIIRLKQELKKGLNALGDIKGEIK